MILWKLKKATKNKQSQQQDKPGGKLWREGDEEKKITKTFGIIEINMLPIKKRNYKMHKKKHRYF